MRPVVVFYIVSLALLFLIIGAILSVHFFVPEKPRFESVEYNYFTFVNVSGFWETDIKLGRQLYRGTFRFNPFEVENVSINGTFSSSAFNRPPLYLTFDPSSDPESFKYQALALSELSLHLVRALNISVEGACTKNDTDACLNRSIVSCETPNVSVIYVVPEGEPSIVLDNRCITLYGREFGLVKAVDRLLYQWYNIIS